jgi:hypothetical protein
MDFLFLVTICAVVGLSVGLDTLCDHLQRKK